VTTSVWKKAQAVWFFPIYNSKLFMKPKASRISKPHCRFKIHLSQQGFKHWKLRKAYWKANLMIVGQDPQAAAEVMAELRKGKGKERLQRVLLLL
jgi:hypothetical protein